MTNKNSTIRDRLQTALEIVPVKIKTPTINELIFKTKENMTNLAIISFKLCHCCDDNFIKIIKLLVTIVNSHANTTIWNLNEREQAPAKYAHYWRDHKKNRLNES